MKLSKRIGAIILCVSMLLTVMPTFTFAAVDATNFESVTLTKSNVLTIGGDTTYGRIIVKANGIPFDVSQANVLKGCYLNGTVTYSGTGDYTKEVKFVDVPITQSDDQTNISGRQVALDFNKWPGNTIAADATVFANDYDVNLTITREALTNSSNFEPIKITEANFAALGEPAPGTQRIIVKTRTFPFDVSQSDALKDCYLNGTMAYFGDDTALAPYIEFINVPISSSAQRTESGRQAQIDFKEWGGLAISNDWSQITNYVVDLTVSREPITVDETNFAPVRITSANQVLGFGVVGNEHRIVLVDSVLPFDITAVDQLVGCYLNGTLTCSDAAYTAEVTFDNVPLKEAELRGSGFTAAFDKPEGVTIGTDMSKYTFDLTITPAADVKAKNFASKGKYMITKNGYDKVTVLTVTYDANGDILTKNIVKDQNIAWNNPYVGTLSVNQRVFVWESISTMRPLTGVIEK